MKNGGEWTEGRYRSFITSCIRGGFRRWPPKYKVLAKAKVGKFLNPASGRIATMYKCNKCKQKFPATDVQVDHRKPVVSITGFTSWDDFIHSLFCEEDNLQVLCKSCHKIKSKLERQKKQ